MFIFLPGRQARGVSLPCGYAFPLYAPRPRAIRPRWAGTATVMTGRARQLQNQGPVQGVARCECNQSARPAFEDHGKRIEVNKAAACPCWLDSPSSQDTPERSS